MQSNNPFLRKCLYCGANFETKHGNRQFCPSELLKPNQRDCKITYNNLKAKKLRDETKEFNQAALKNMLILDRFYEDDNRIVYDKELEKVGFDPAKSTGVIRDAESDQLVPIFYKYKLISTPKNLFIIEKV